MEDSICQKDLLDVLYSITESKLKNRSQNLQKQVVLRNFLRKLRLLQTDDAIFTKKRKSICVVNVDCDDTTNSDQVVPQAKRQCRRIQPRPVDKLK